MTSKGTGPTAPPASDEGITIHNRLPAGHRYREAMDEVFRVSLRDLPGPWDVSVCSVGRAWFRIDVLAPDGASWSGSVPVHEGPSAEDGRRLGSASKAHKATEAATPSSQDAVGGTLK